MAREGRLFKHDKRASGFASPPLVSGPVVQLQASSIDRQHAQLSARDCSSRSRTSCQFAG